MILDSIAQFSAISEFDSPIGQNSTENEHPISELYTLIPRAAKVVLEGMDLMLKPRTVFSLLMLFFSPWTCQALPNSEASTLNASFIRIDVVVLIGGFFAFLLFTTVIVFLYKHLGGQTTMISELLDAFESDRRERDENSARPTTDGSDEINRARDDANTHSCLRSK